MRVNVTYSVDLDEVSQTTANLIRNTKDDSLVPLAKKLDEALDLLDKEDEKNAVRYLDEVRRELSKIDLRIADCMNILLGYQNVLLGNVEEPETSIDSPELKEATNEKG